MSPLGKLVQDIQRKQWQKKVLMPLTPSTQNGYPIDFLRQLSRHRNQGKPEAWNRDDHCPWCRGTIVEPTIEHVIPKSRGGTDAIRNTVWACRECNEARSNTPVIVWLVALSMVPDRNPWLARDWVKEHLPKE